jgi:hypothetical protein
VAPIQDLSAARPFFVDVELFEGYVGEDIEQYDRDVVLKFRSTGTGEILGVRFPAPAFPQEGLAYRGVWLRNVRDWILDLKVVLTEEIATGALFGIPPTPHIGWKELSLAPDRWAGEPGRTIEDWSDP